MFTPINFEAVREMVYRLPRRVQLTGYVVLVHLLSQARRYPGRYNGLDLQRGDISTVRRDIPEQIPVTEQQFRTILIHLQKEGFLTQKLTRPNIVLNICNLGIYVNDNYESNPKSNPEVTQKQPRSNPPILDVVVKDKGEKIKETALPDGDTTYLSQVAEIYLTLCPTAPQKIPYSLFNRWRKEMAAAQKLAGNTATAEKVILAILTEIASKKTSDDFENEKNTRSYLVDMLRIKQDEVIARLSPSQPNQQQRYAIFNENGNPITDPERRRKFILDRNPAATEDPDQGYPFTLSAAYLTGRSSTP